MRATRRIEILLGGGFWTVVAVTALVRGAADAMLPYAAAAVLGALVWTLVLRRSAAATTVLDWLPFPFVVLTYEMLHAVVPRCWQGTIDATLRAADQSILGADLTSLLGSWPDAGGAAFFSACYATYYVLPLSLAVWWWRRNRTAFRELMAGVVGGLFIGYLGYLFLPAVGPQAHLAVEDGGGLLAGDFVGTAIRSLNSSHAGAFPRDAFPSLHTCNAVTAVLVTIRHERRALWYAGALAAGIVAATIVLRWHWMVDVLAGAALAVAWQAVVPRFVACESAAYTSDRKRP